MTPGRSYCVLTILLAIVDIQSGGCVNISSSAAREGERLHVICTLWYKEEEAEGLVVFLCKDRSWDCSPETSLEQLIIRRAPGTDGATERSSQLVYTISKATPLDSGTYQCCVRSQKPEMHLQGHFFSVFVTETGNYTVTGLKPRHLDFSGSDNTVSPGFLLVKALVMLVSSLVTLQVL